MRRFLVIFLWCLANGEYYDVFSGREINRTRYEELDRLGAVPYCAIQVAPCDAHEPRRMDSSCNNLRYPPRGATLTPFRRLLPPSFSPGGGLATAASGKPLPLVRPLRVALMSDGRQSSDRYTHMLANYNVFITADITSVHDTVNYVAVTRTCCQSGGDKDPRCIPVEVKNDDVHLRRSNIRCMNLTRAITYQRLGCLPDDVPPERINSAPPSLELSIVYGQDERGARKGREFRQGRLKGELVNGAEWPPSSGAVCVNNVSPRETRCHDVPTNGANSVLGLNIMFLWFYRSHNAISRALSEINPCWDDDQLYYTAKEINIAYYVHIMYYEMMTELLGWDFLLKNRVVFPTRGHVNDYDPTLPPGLSIEYVIATRWFHTVQDGRLKLYTKDGRLYDQVSVVDFNLRTGALPVNNTIEGMTQGVFRQAGADMDALVDPDVGERILGRLQLASDVLSSDLLKGRDVGLPPYNQYRKLCGLPEAKKFKDLLGWMNRPQVEALGLFYESPDDIDLFAGLLAELPPRGAVLGPTLACIMTEQLLYWRRSDRFWYENEEHPGAFTKEQLLEIRKMTLAKLICQHGDGVDAIQPKAFIVTGPGNEITNCSDYEMPNLYVFRDERCKTKTSGRDGYPNPLISDFGTRGTNLYNPLLNYSTNIWVPVDPPKLFNKDYPNVNPLTDKDNSNVNPKLKDYEYPDSSPIIERLNNPDNKNLNSKLSSLYPIDRKVNIYPSLDTSGLKEESPKVVSNQGYLNTPATPRFDGYSDIFYGISRTSEYTDPVFRDSGYKVSYGKSLNSSPFQTFLNLG